MRILLAKCTNLHIDRMSWQKFNFICLVAYVQKVIYINIPNVCSTCFSPNHLVKMTAPLKLGIGNRPTILELGNKEHNPKESQRHDKTESEVMGWTTINIEIKKQAKLTGWP